MKQVYIDWIFYQAYFRIDQIQSKTKASCYIRKYDNNNYFFINSNILIFKFWYSERCFELVDLKKLPEYINVSFILVDTIAIEEKFFYVFKPIINSILDLDEEFVHNKEDLEFYLPFYLFNDLILRCCYFQVNNVIKMKDILDFIELKEFASAGLLSNRVKKYFDSNNLKIQLIEDFFENNVYLFVTKYKSKFLQVDSFDKILVYQVNMKADNEFVGYVLLNTNYWFENGISYETHINNDKYVDELLIRFSNYLVDYSSTSVLYPVDRRSIKHIFRNTDFVLLGDSVELFSFEKEFETKYKVNLLEKIESKTKSIFDSWLKK